MLVLFDVDGTLLLTDRAGTKAMQEAGKQVVGEHWDLSRVEFAGRLDPLIWADGARHAGIEPDEDLHRRFREAYAASLARRLADGHPAHTLPGVDALVARLAERQDVTLGLLTGNYPETGRLKLEAAGLDPGLFPVTAWGTDGPDRRALPPAAMAHYRDLTGTAIAPWATVIVGDTVHDVDCAHANECLAVAVATGPSYSMDDLRRHGPELLLADLTDTEGFTAWMDAYRPYF